MSSVLGVSVGSGAIRVARPRTADPAKRFQLDSFELQSFDTAFQQVEELAAETVSAALQSSPPGVGVALAYRDVEVAESLRASLARRQINDSELIPETAAILEFLAASGVIKGLSTIAVYDLGASGLTVSVLDTRNRTTLHAERTDEVSGALFDAMIREYQISTGRIATPTSPEGFVVLDARCRRGKEQLSINPAAALPSDSGMVLLSRENFEAMIAPAVEASARMTVSVMQNCGTPVEAVVAIGGGARIPLVRTVLAQWVGAPLIVGEGPETVAARGAALLARPAPPQAAPPPGPHRRPAPNGGPGYSTGPTPTVPVGLPQRQPQQPQPQRPMPPAPAFAQQQPVPPTQPFAAPPAPVAPPAPPTVAMQLPPQGPPSKPQPPVVPTTVIVTAPESPADAQPTQAMVMPTAADVAPPTERFAAPTPVPPAAEPEQQGFPDENQWSQAVNGPVGDEVTMEAPAWLAPAEQPATKKRGKNKKREPEPDTWTESDPWATASPHAAAPAAAWPQAAPQQQQQPLPPSQPQQQYPREDFADDFAAQLAPKKPVRRGKSPAALIGIAAAALLIVGGLGAGLVYGTKAFQDTVTTAATSSTTTAPTTTVAVTTTTEAAPVAPAAPPPPETSTTTTTTAPPPQQQYWRPRRPAPPPPAAPGPNTFIVPGLPPIVVPTR